MADAQLDAKIREVFQEFAIDKGLVRRLGVSGDDRHVPSYVLDWIVTLKSKSGSSTTSLQREVENFVQQHLPAKGEKERVKFRLSQGETLTLLDAISVEVRLGTEVQYFASIPCLDEKRAIVDATLIANNEGLLQGSTWGAVRIKYETGDHGAGIHVVDFKPMQAGRVSLDAFFECRKAFTVEEWIDVLIRTMGYEPSKYSEDEKLWMLCRLIPVVHNRVNMMELAPPGSGKSYVYNNISRHVWLTAAEISPAVLFYNRQRKAPGLLTQYDLLVLDEAQSIRFTNAPEIQAQLKGYLEQGVYTRGDVSATAECGLMLLANIDLKQDAEHKYHNNKPAFLPARSDYIRRLPEVFLESPLVDRFHGIIPGWKIPSFHTEQQAMGPGLKADYFAEVCHALRSVSQLSQAVRAKLRLTGGKRDCTAVERLACGMAKLLVIEPDHPRFDDLVLTRAQELRRLVRTQLHALDPQGYPPELQISRAGQTQSSSPRERLHQYELLEEVGRGGMSRVYRCLDTSSGSIVALKRVATEGIRVDDAAIQREISIYHKLRHIENDHLLIVKDIFRDGNIYAIVTEYADGGSLWELMGGDPQDKPRTPLDARTVQGIALELLDGLCALHENNLVHRDIKPHNILRCDDKWKIGDFGISKLLNKPVTGYTFQGAHSMPWAPREQIEGAQAHPSADIYAFGRVLGFLLTGSIKTAALPALPPPWRELVSTCTAEDPDARPNGASVKKLIEGFHV
jgi:ATP-dependent Lon protease